ncbi:helix-turn-helix domain-containing protein [Stackebrandtia nassauensis]|uniref:Helix-turn-helix domain protein n=1 Tax=Stackebrandtia nassauensis (strain DSM 44728 / CIP 108903 / NRRL B-16338 / NBRC 102104 / LLR-40K-21) TaxID=446470 RepID=D3Q8V6_STANL|nr:helix-turn-helix transcriptional regulator [Stackebrandtia nassauensis]ADD44548.1 helix-turn-helix domain protein [Stackebrandtia nassauensis DSM 44728]
MVEGPLFTRKQLGIRLRELRHASGKTVEDIEVADIMGKSKLYYIEAGRQPKPSWPEIKELAELLGADTALRNELVRMAKDCLRSGWYVPFDVPQQFQPYLDLEGAATKLSFFEVEYVNGLFQTDAYTRAIQVGWGLKGAELDHTQTFRAQRKKRFWQRDPAPEVVLVMSEAAVRRQVGGPEVMAEQMVHLRKLAEKPNVAIRVVPYSAGSYPSMGGNYTLLEFKSGAYPEVAYVESRAECQYHERAAVVALYKRILQETLDIAVLMEEMQL